MRMVVTPSSSSPSVNNCSFCIVLESESSPVPSPSPENSPQKRRCGQRLKRFFGAAVKKMRVLLTRQDGGGNSSDKSSSATDLVAEEDTRFPSRPAICRIPLMKHADLGLSFSGCGFLGTYHFGVVSCFLKNGKPLLCRLRRMGGASVGSLVAAILLLAPEAVPNGLTSLYDLADELNSLKFGALSPGFYLNDRLRKIVDDYIPQDISAVQHRLVISVTNNKTRANRLISQFHSRDYLVDCLMASCYIPMYSMGLSAEAPLLDGEGFIDGGYSNNLPDFEDLRTVTVSPFSGAVDISPSDPEVLFDWKMSLGNQQMKVNLRNVVRGAQALFPPSRAALHQYYAMGFKDAFTFLLENGLLQREVGSPV